METVHSEYLWFRLHFSLSAISGIAIPQLCGLQFHNLLNGNSMVQIEIVFQGRTSQSGCANLLCCKFVAENCMKIKEIGPIGGRASLDSPSDPPMYLPFSKIYRIAI